MTNSLRDFLPEVPKDGYIGYYPADPDKWEDLPLPLRCSTWFQPVEYVIFSAYLTSLKMNVEVKVHAQNAFKALFCLTKAEPQLYTVAGIVTYKGARTFAKWMQDTRTGAFALFSGSGSMVAKQGGYSGFMPENCQKTEAGDWGLDCGVRSNNINHFCLV